VAKKEKQQRDSARVSQKDAPEQFRSGPEDRFPSLTQDYWKNPNSSKGRISLCPGAEPMDRDQYLEQGI
jgi:hypothetical protein